jgi:hypothetical protein
LQEGNFLGAFQVGSTIPTTNLKEQRFFTRPGIWADATIGSHYAYPGFTADTSFLTLSARDTSVLTPFFRTRPDSVFPVFFFEDFENTARPIRFEAYPEAFVGPGQPANSARFRRSTHQPYAGNYCMEVDLGTRDSIMALLSIGNYIGTNDLLFLPRLGQVWVEVHYKGDIKFGLSLFSFSGNPTDPNNRVSFIDPAIRIPQAPFDSTAWQSCYFNINPHILRSANLSEHRLYLVAINTSGRPRKLYLDDIRIVLFQNV